MFLKKTYLNKSKIDGVGLFANEPIQQGEVVYTHSAQFQHVLTQEELETLPQSERRTFEHYGYKRDGKWYLDFDDIRFVNHSDTPNLKLTDTGITAARDISAGEELTQDYRDFEDEVRF